MVLPEGVVNLEWTFIESGRNKQKPGGAHRPPIVQDYLIRKRNISCKYGVSIVHPSAISSRGTASFSTIFKVYV